MKIEDKRKTKSTVCELDTKALENDTWWHIFQKCAAERVCMFLRSIALVLVTITRLKKEETTL